GLVSVIDYTFASPMNFKPLAIGFDVCFHSATKYLNGHSDVVAGCAAGGRSAIESIRRSLNQLGGSLDPHAGFLLARSLKTLALRVRAQNENASKLAGFLEDDPRVAEVHYPGLVSHPDHERGRRLMSGFGGMLSFRLAGTSPGEVDEVLARLGIAYVATSLGSVETLVTRPAATSHAALTVEQRERVGITDDLVRVSCGVEDADDLVADFDQAMA
ncbi:MAG TPA: PLP-dependent transferase, partial [Actinomycetota bacterium]|nr:PLP-dependent transferase [Actinomycetota bacterium]